MNSKVAWNDQIPERDGIKTPINDIAISPGNYNYNNFFICPIHLLIK